jgi:phosphate transport system protein
MSQPDSPVFRHFHDQLDALKQRLLDMSERAESLIALAIEALLQRDQLKAEAVIEGDHELDSIEIEVEKLAVELLATQQPMARDLRFIVSAIRVTSDLERVGDHAVNIAQASLRLSGTRPLVVPEADIKAMARDACKMLADSLDAFISGDGRLGREVCIRDDGVDRQHDRLFKLLLGQMTESSAMVHHSLQLLLVSRNLERVADLATNIGEDAVFLAEGKQIRHHFEEKQDSSALPAS